MQPLGGSGYRVVIRTQKDTLVLGHERTATDARRVVANTVRSWRFGDLACQAGLARRFSATIENDYPRSYELRYASSRRRFGVLAYEKETP